MLELSDYDENEEAHKSGNVECVEVNNGIKMANKRSKSLEKEETDDVKRGNSELLKRPDTAPPLFPDLAGPKQDIAEHGGDEERTATWHEHIYRKPPKMPTPFSIVDILWGNCKPTASPRIERNSDRNNNSNRSYQNVEPSTLQQLLNLNIKTPSPRAFHNSNSLSRRRMSLSETSEDESVASDQPLNLCVTKSRDSSPGADRSIGKTKKGANHCLPITESVSNLSQYGNVFHLPP
jgi:hypothetical protein